MTTAATKSTRKGKDGPNAVDAHVGARLRARRLRLGWSQAKLGDAVGLTFQQIQKYERGANRIGAGRLFAFAQILRVDIAYFYAGLDAGRPVDPEPGVPRALLKLARNWDRLQPRQADAIANVINVTAALNAAPHTTH